MQLEHFQTPYPISLDCVHLLNNPTIVLSLFIGLGNCGISVWTHPTICGAWIEILQPVAVDSILVLELDLDCLWEPEMAKGPYPTDKLASVLDAETALSRLVVSPENCVELC